MYTLRIVSRENRLVLRKTKSTVKINAKIKRGLPGSDGKSAYQTWLDEGNTGTEHDFLNSLKGTKGDPGEDADSNNPVYYTDGFDSIQAAIDAAKEGGGGIVELPEGTFTLPASLVLPSKVWLRGQGQETTILTLASGVNGSVIKTESFDTLTGTDSTLGDHSFGITNLTIDGNKANQTAGHGIAIYGYGYHLNEITIRNTKGWNLWSEWGSQSLLPDDVGIECHVRSFKFSEGDAGGIYFKGPHDSHFYDGVVWRLTSVGAIANMFHIDGEQFSNGSVVQNVHIWGGTFNYGVRIDANGISLKDCQLEGATEAEVYNNGHNTHIENCKIFSIGTALTNIKGVKMGAGISNLYMRAKMEDIGGGLIDMTGAGGNHNIEIFANYYSAGVSIPNPAIIGTIDAQSYIRVHMLNADGTLNLQNSFIQWPASMTSTEFTEGGLSLEDKYVLKSGDTMTGPITATAATIVPAGGSGTLTVSSSPVSDNASMILRGHNAANNGDFLTMEIRTGQPDVVASVYDNSSATYYEFFKYKYLMQLFEFGTNTALFFRGGYNAPSDENMVVLQHKDSSNNATKPTWGIAFENDADDYDGAPDKHSRIFAERMEDWGDRIDLVASTWHGGAVNEHFRVHDKGVRISNTTPPATATSAGVAGDIAWDANYIYVCVAANTWKRTALSTW